MLIHEDFRTGNYLVDEQGLTAILDWEFGAWGDPDVRHRLVLAPSAGASAPLIARPAASPRGRRSIAATRRASGRRIDPAAVHYWEVAAHVRWAVIALQQAARHLSGAQRSLELALTGRIVPGTRARDPEPDRCRRGQGGLMTDTPDGAALLEEARRTLLEILLPLLPPERRYDGLMVANAMAIAAREAGQGRAPSARPCNMLSALFPAASADDNLRAHLLELEARLARRNSRRPVRRPGARRDAVRDYLRRSVTARARVSNPEGPVALGACSSAPLQETNALR